jgi:hypothetical protein
LSILYICLYAIITSGIFVGLSWRWSLVAIEGQLNLQLQALPVNGNHIRAGPAFQQDDLSVVRLASYPVEGNTFDGDLAAGPVPIFFSNKPEETLKRLLN